MRKIANVYMVFMIIGVSNSFSQGLTIVNNQVSLFSINQKSDTINYVVVDTILDKKKPVFLWCQGSRPMPLFFEKEKDEFAFFGGGIVNFEYQKIVKDFHLVVISMPKTPVIGVRKNLNNQYYYVPDTSKPYQMSEEFIATNFLEFYVKRANRVIEELKNKPWVDTTTFVIAGHSQGTKIATKVSVSNPVFTHTGLFAANPMGRIDQFIREIRLEAQLGNISWEEADNQMNYWMSEYKQAYNVDSLKKYPNLNQWTSWGERFYDDWLAINHPIYLAYGSQDRVADLCDLVPLYFIEKGKENLTIKRYNNLEHNFFEKKNGVVNYNKPHWNEVINEFLIWLK